MISPVSGSLELLAIVQSYGSDNVINLPTRITVETGTLIDLCITNCHTEAAGVFSCDLSDHFPIFSFIVGPVNLKLSSNNAAETFRRIDNSSIELFHILRYRI